MVNLDSVTEYIYLNCETLQNITIPKKELYNNIKNFESSFINNMNKLNSVHDLTKKLKLLPIEIKEIRTSKSRCFKFPKDLIDTLIFEME